MSLIRELPRLILILATVFSFILSFVNHVAAVDTITTLKSQARDYYKGRRGEQSYEKALKLYLKAAERGDAEAQYISGGMYFEGLGTRKNFPAAFKLLHQAALNGKSSSISQQIIGQAFLLGSGVPKNYKEALKWYGLSAENGNSEAQNELGYMYFSGNGVKHDPKKAAKLFLQAAESGLAIAQYNMGILYYTGNGVQAADLKKAYSWMNVAASNGHQPAIAARDFLETTLSKEEMTQAQQLSLSLLKK